MTRRSQWIAIVLGVALARACMADDSKPRFIKLFNGKDLSGWEGDMRAWAVRDGAITCLGNSSRKNWLIWRGGQPEHFELRLRFKFVQGNSGVQVRSKEIAKWQVGGYQLEVAERAKMGMWHHSLKPAEHRHYLATAGQRVRIRADGQKDVEQVADAAEVQANYHENDWNDLVVIGRGPKLTQIINGVVFSELIDEERRYATRAGVIAFQDHGKGTVAKFKDIRLKRFADAQATKRISVTNVEDLRSAADSLSPGSVIDIAPGTYELSSRVTNKVRGAEDRPVVIRAGKPGEAKVRGEGEIVVDESSHVTIDGLTFQGKRGIDCQHSEHVRITNCRFRLEQTGEKSKWLGFNDSRHGRVDHCEFGAREDPGSYIHISRGNRYFRIDHNYFHDFQQLGYNGGESIYLHGTGVWAIHAVVERNLFERCNGEGELIGIKSHRNIIRGNTFKDCLGAVSIRDGNYNSVYDNVFLAPDEPRAAGVRIHGKHNAFVNNYLSGIYKPIECCWGETDAPHRENLTGHGNVTKLAFAYRASYDNLVAHNTFVACDTVFQWTKKRIPMEHIREKMRLVERNGPFLAKLWVQETSQFRAGDFVEPTYPPRHWFVLNNVIVNTPQLVRVNLARDTTPPVREDDFRWQGNLAFCAMGDFDVGPGRSFDDNQIRYDDPELIEEASGLFRPSPSSVCRNRGEIDMKTVRSYIDRPETEAVLGAITDLGASGYRMLTIAQVGPRSSTKPAAANE
jgi:hypothetical protein